MQWLRCGQGHGGARTLHSDVLPSMVHTLTVPFAAPTYRSLLTPLSSKASVVNTQSLRCSGRSKGVTLRQRTSHNDALNRSVAVASYAAHIREFSNRSLSVRLGGFLHADPHGSRCGGARGAGERVRGRTAELKVHHSEEADGHKGGRVGIPRDLVHRRLCARLRHKLAPNTQHDSSRGDLTVRGTRARRKQRQEQHNKQKRGSTRQPTARDPTRLHCVPRRHRWRRGNARWGQRRAPARRARGR